MEWCGGFIVARFAHTHVLPFIVSSKQLLVSLSVQPQKLVKKVQVPDPDYLDDCPNRG